MTQAIVSGRLIDGTGADPVANGVVLINDTGVIEQAGSADKIKIPADATVLDAAGRTIMPGIIDCHVHATYRSRDVRQHLLNTPTYNILKSTTIIEETLACGVTTARDMGGADAGFREAIADGVIPGPRLLVSIVMISQTGGHGDFWVPAGFHVPKRAWLPSPVADGVEEVRRLVRQLLMAGADFIKICSSGGITSVTDSWDEPQYTVDEIRVAVTTAAAKGKRVAVHAEGLNGIRLALDAGVHSLEHGWFIDEQCVEQMLRQGTWWVPTLALVPLSSERRKRDPRWSGQQLGDEARKDQEILDAMERHKPLWRDAVKRGLNVATGTDQSHRLMVGENLVELEFMQDFLGLSPMDVIVASTTRAAECIERSDLGALAPGKRADVLVVDGDPLDDLRVLQDRQRLHLVMKDGVAYSDRLTD